MLVRVGKLFEQGGRPLPRHREVTQQPTHLGKLSYTDQHEMEFRRSVYTAYLRSTDTGNDVLPPLRDAVVRFIADGHMTISGVEVDADTRCRVAQSWYVEILNT